MTTRQWKNITDYMDTVGTTLKTFTFPKTQNLVKVTIRGNANVTYAIGSQSGTLTPGQSISVSEKITSFNLTAASGTQIVEVWAIEDGTQKKESSINKRDSLNQKILPISSLKQLPSVMATPPTVALSAANAASTITNFQFINAGISGQTGINNLFRWMGDAYRADWNGVTYAGNFPDYSYVKNKAISGLPLYLSGPIDVEFIVDDISFEIIVQGKGQSTSWRILIDEGQGYQSVFADPAPSSIPNDANQYNILLTFATRKLRRVRFQSADCGFKGINIGPNGTALPASRPSSSKLIVMGDSFTEGTGANGWFNGYATIVGTMLGMDYWTCGSGGTGYMNPNTGLNRVKYQDRVQHDVIGYNPDIVIIQGGQNDTTYLKSDVQNAADLLYKTLKSAMPSVPIIAISNIAIASVTTAITDTRDAIKAAAINNGVALIDSIDGITYDFEGNALNTAYGNWFSGSGNVGSPQPTGNRSIYTWTDGGHPTNDGHRYIGERIAGEVYKLLSN